METSEAEPAVAEDRRVGIKDFIPIDGILRKYHSDIRKD
jgi:hypothetical protein